MSKDFICLDCKWGDGTAPGRAYCTKVGFACNGEQCTPVIVCDDFEPRTGFTPLRPTNYVRVKTGDYAGVIGKVNVIQKDVEYPIHVAFANGEKNYYYPEQVEKVDLSQLSDFDRDQAIHFSFFRDQISRQN